MRFLGTCLITKDVIGLARFYGRVLNVDYEENDTHVDFPVPGGTFSIYSRQAAIADMGFDFPPDAGYGYATLMFSVTDVDAEFTRLLSYGVEFMTRPKTYPWGARSCHFRDPDGNIVDLVSPPPPR
jgi:predicted enzyme related to lactoylglutathione lyase